MKIIEDAGHPIFTGAFPLSKGELLDEGRNEHFAASWPNEKMLVRFIYDSNALSSFLALWKYLPSKPKISSDSKSATQAGGDPAQSSSSTGIKAERPKEQAAVDRSDLEASAAVSVENK